MPDQGSPGLDIELLPIPAVLFDHEFRIVRWNAVCEDLFGYSELEARGRRVVDLLTAGLPEGVPEDTGDRLREQLLSGQVVQQTARMQTRAGDVRWLEFVSQPIIRAEGFAGALSLFVDVTERFENAEQLAASEQRLRTVLLDTPIIACMSDAESRITLATRSLAALAGASEPGDIEGRRWADVFGSYPEDDRFWSELAAGRVIDSYEGRIRSVRGERRIVWSNVLLDGAEGPTAASIGLDVTRERMAQEELVVAQQRLRRLVREVLHAERLERDRIAEGLHDDTVQVLVATLTQLDRVTARLTDPELRDIAESARSMLSEASDRARRLMFDLHPASLYARGLRAAVAELAHSAAAAGGFEVTANVCDARFAADVEELTFRTIREALTNAVKHSAARHVSVEVVDEPARLRAAIVDDGRGFDATAARVHELGRLHLGMPSMSRRILAVGGEFRTESAPGAGTSVRFSVPKLGSQALVS